MRTCADQLPAGWCLAPIESLIAAPIVYGILQPGPNLSDGVPYVRPTEIDVDRINVADIRRTSPAIAAKYERSKLNAGDVILSIVGTIGKVAIVPDSLDGGNITQSSARVRIDSRALSSAYMAWALRSPQLIRQYDGFRLGTAVPRLNLAHVRDLKILLAPKGEQARIVEALDSYLSRLDAAVVSLERVQAKLRLYRASVLKAAVEGRLVPTEAELARQEQRDYEPASVLLERILKERRRRWEEAELARLQKAGKAPKDEKWKAKYKEPVAPDTSDLPGLPEGWCWASVDQVGDVLLGRQRAPQYLTGKWSRPYLRVANIKDDRIDFDDIESMDFDDEHFAKYQLLPGDILVSEGQSPHLVGQSAIYRGGIDGLCFQKTLHRFRAVSGGPSPEFAQIVFRAHVRLSVFKAVAAITTNIAHLTLEKFKISRFPLPPLSEQVRIETEVSRILTIADAVDGQAAREKVRLARLRQGVLKWGFEGKLVDQDPADEPAEKLLERIRAERAAATDAAPSRRRGRRSAKRATAGGRQMA